MNGSPRSLSRYAEIVKIERFIGQPYDSLSLRDRWRIAGSWIALEIYTPATVPLRIIEAIGPSAQVCSRQLIERGLDPGRYEFWACPAPYQP